VRRGVLAEPSSAASSRDSRFQILLVAKQMEATLMRGQDE
jgi:hypothetical protein